MKVRIIKHFHNFDAYSYNEVHVSFLDLKLGEPYLMITKAAHLEGDYGFNENMIDYVRRYPHMVDVVGLTKGVMEDYSTLSEEELFQKSLVHKTTLPIEVIAAMQRVGKSFIHEGYRYEYEKIYEMEIQL